MEWSPKLAMQAYLQTLHLSCKADNRNDQKYSARLNKQREGEGARRGINTVEPRGLELISALAAGNQARVLVQIMASYSDGITPLTIALAVAATQTGGKIICVLPYHHHHHLTTSTIRHQLSLCGLLSTSTINHDHDHVQDAVVELRVGDPHDQIKDLKNIDFAVIDGQFDHYDLLCQNLHLNPKGAIIVANNWLYTGQVSVAQLVDQLLKGRKGVQSSVTILPLESPGHVQVILKIRSTFMANVNLRRHKRFVVTFNP